MDQSTRQLLRKVANSQFPQNANLMGPGMNLAADPTAYGFQLGQHVQNYPGYSPGSPEATEWARQNQWSPEFVRGVYALQQRGLGAASDPNFLRTMASGSTPNWGQLTAGIDPSQVVNTEQLATSAPGAVAQGAAGKALKYFSSWLPQNSTAATALQQTAANMTQGIVDRFQPQAQQGFISSLDRNSPFVRRMMANAGTTYMGNKIDDWTSGMGGFGRGLRGAGHFMLGLLSRMPGYEYLVNKGVDWFGPDMSRYFPATKKSAYLGPALPAHAAAKAASVSPYSHYRSVRIGPGVEVLSPWNRR